MRFKFENTKPEIGDADLIADLQRVCAARCAKTVSQRTYRTAGRYSTTTIKDRFGSWNAALTAAGLTVSAKRHIPDDELLDNLRSVWMRLGRQPRKREMITPVSTYSHHPYVRRFGGWLNAVRAFCEVIDQATELDDRHTASNRPARGPRDPSLRLRFLVMRRDQFKCVLCGESPATDPQVVLHVDHILAWSKGGETKADNLQTLCSACNLGKSDLSLS